MGAGTQCVWGDTVWLVPWLSLDSCVAPATARFMLYIVLDPSAFCPQQHNGLPEDGNHTHPQVAFLNAPVRTGCTESKPRMSQEQGFQPATLHRFKAEMRGLTPVSRNRSED